MPRVFQFTIYGRAFPAADTIPVRVDETLKARFIGSNSGFVHPMRMHAGPFQVVAVNGQTLQPSARYPADTVNAGPGYIAHHTTNNKAEIRGDGGLIVVIEVSSR